MTDRHYFRLHCCKGSFPVCEGGFPTVNAALDRARALMLHETTYDFRIADVTGTICLKESEIRLKNYVANG
jgi:hypothetical protein